MAAAVPDTRYANIGGCHVAYRVLGSGPIDLVLALGFVSHLDVFWEYPPSFVSSVA
jgi:hypothetical protein